MDFLLPPLLARRFRLCALRCPPLHRRSTRAHTYTHVHMCAHAHSTYTQAHVQTRTYLVTQMQGGSLCLLSVVFASSARLFSSTFSCVPLHLLALSCIESWLPCVVVVRARVGEWRLKYGSQLFCLVCVPRLPVQLPLRPYLSVEKLPPEHADKLAPPHFILPLSPSHSCLASNSPRKRWKPLSSPRSPSHLFLSVLSQPVFLSRSHPPNMLNKRTPHHSILPCATSSGTC